MMNMYREEESTVKPKNGIIKGIKQSVQTNPVYRLAIIKKVEKAIKTTSIEDVEALKSIETIIQKLDLADAQFGRGINDELLAMFNEKLAASQDLKDRDLTQV